MDLFGVKKRRNIKKFDNELNLAISASIERFGSANAEHFMAHAELARISNFKLNENPDLSQRNIIQQAGFSAEVKRTARVNADSIINNKDKRIARTDDVGSVNHTQYDHVEVDSKGKPLLNADSTFSKGSQQKSFSKIENYDKLFNKEFEHYEGVALDVPSDHLSAIVERCEKKITDFKQQKDFLIAKGDLEKASAVDEKIKRMTNVKSRLRDSGVSYEDGLEARKSHTYSTIKDISKISNKAGVESAKVGALFGGSISAITNTHAFAKGDKQAKAAVYQVLKDTSESSAKAYIYGATGAAVGGALKASSSQVCRNLAKKNGPTAILQVGTVLAKQTTKLLSGKINGTQFVEGIGQEGMMLASTLTGSNLGALVGSIAVPGAGTIVGGAIGGIVTSLLSGALHRELQCSINNTKLSDEKRIAVQKLCDDLIEQEKQYREDALVIFNHFFSEKELMIKTGFEQLSTSIQNGEGISDGLVTLGEAFDLKLKFANVDELKNHIEKGETLRF